MNIFFSHLFLYLKTALTEKDYCHPKKSPTTAGLITAVITGRGNLEEHAVRSRRGVWPRRGVIFEEVGRSRVSSFSVFFFFSFFFSVIVEKSKSAIEAPVLRAARKVTVEENAVRKAVRAEEKRLFSKG